MIKYSFLVPTKNNIHFTERLLISLLDDVVKEGIYQDEFEIVLLDSNSEDGIEELVDFYKGVNIKLIKIDPSKDSFSFKNNFGAKKALGEYLIFINNDVEVLDSLIRPMERVLEFRPDIGIVSNKHYFPNMTINHVGIAFKDDRTPTHLYPGLKDGELPVLNKSREVPAVTAACCMVRKQEFLDIGGFDENYIYGYEDVDLCLKYRKNLNKVSYVVTDSKIIHFGQSTYGRTKNEDQNRDYFLSKWKDVDLPLLGDIYRQDGTLNYMRKVGQNIPRESKSLFKSIKEVKNSNINLESPSIIFFFDENVKNSFNMVVKHLYYAFLNRYGNKYNVKKDSPSNFYKYRETDDITITWTHFWTDYYVEDRIDPNRDFRLFAVNYEWDKDSIPDFWVQHIKKSKFKVLAISNYCIKFLKDAGVDSSRLLLQHIGFGIDGIKEYLHESKPKHDKIKYLIITNSNDLGRYNTKVAIKTFYNTFKGLTDKVSLTIKDYGGNSDVINNLIKELKATIDVNFINRFVPDKEMADLLFDHDVLIAPFKGEGFGMKIIDAAVLGNIIISPFYGGPVDFLKQCAHVPVKYELENVTDTLDTKFLLTANTYKQCLVKKNSLKNALRESFDNFKLLHSLAEEQRVEIFNLFNWISLADRLFEYIKPVLGGSINRSLKKNVLITRYKNVEEVFVNNISNRKRPELSILINSYNRPELIDKRLRDFLKLPDLQNLNYEIVIVDDGSTKDYMSVISKYKDSPLPIRYFKYTPNRGMTFVKNVALLKARGKIGVFMGDDIKPLPGFFSRRLSLHKQLGQKVLVLGHTEWDKDIRNNLVADFSTKRTGFQFSYEVFRNNYYWDLIHLYTSNISFWIEDILKHKLLFLPIEGIKLGEDGIWGQMLKEHGFRMYYERKIEGLHQHPVDLEWLIKRSEVVGATIGRLFIEYPKLTKFLGASNLISELQRFDRRRYTQDVQKYKASIKNFWEKQIRDKYNFLISEYNNQDNFMIRKKIRNLIYELLTTAHSTAFRSGFLRALGIYEYYVPYIFSWIMNKPDNYNISSNVRASLNLMHIRNKYDVAKILMSFMNKILKDIISLKAPNITGHFKSSIIKE